MLSCPRRRRVVEGWGGDVGNLIGFALHYPMYAGFNLQVHPGRRGGKLEESMLARTERRARRLARQEGHAGAIDAWDVFEEEADRIALLERHGRHLVGLTRAERIRDVRDRCVR